MLGIPSPVFTSNPLAPTSSAVRLSSSVTWVASRPGRAVQSKAAAADTIGVA